VEDRDGVRLGRDHQLGEPAAVMLLEDFGAVRKRADRGGWVLRGVDAAIGATAQAVVADAALRRVGRGSLCRPPGRASPSSRWLRRCRRRCGRGSCGGL
jgi:hypothetical protein